MRLKPIFRWVALLSLMALVALAAGGGALYWAWQEVQRPFCGYTSPEVIVEVRPGQGATTILDLLAREGVLSSPKLTRLYLVYVLGDPPLLAGEYRFSSPMTAPQVLERLIGGEVVTYPVTVIEGLTLEETAEALARQGFGARSAFEAAMRRSELIADLDPEATTLEGYLYPDTYSFPRGTSEGRVVSTLVATFRRRFAERMETELGDSRAGPSLRHVVTLASIVEKEARLATERPVIAGVFSNRLRRGMALSADPTIIYALKQLGRWDGNLRRVDLKLDSPYNTYLYPGLPPGPICSPGLASLQAALEPGDVPYLYFVSRNDGSHVFARSFAEHQRNVNQWQRRYWRERWARERQAASNAKP